MTTTTSPVRTLPGEAPVLTKAKQAYSLWFALTPHIPKTYRYTLGGKIETAFLDLLEHIFICLYLPPSKKIEKLYGAISKLDSVKFFLQIAWENKCIPNQKYAELGQSLDEIGRILGGWKKGIENKLEGK